ncbi:hypothetical protein DL96DRAFT_1821026 [Flagelloscypha sp. PMI_526]|nr:hypothetical protein DL96DRAFT_1821026 [Flagelloscypha sp. PMI_526]
MSASKRQPSTGAGLRLLAFDGGGLRAISQALIVQNMCHRLEEDHPLSHPARIRDYFDMICGSGLGGLLAIMCGILSLTGDELVDEFVAICNAVFSGHLDPKERTLRLENEVRRIVAKFSEGREERKMLSDHDTCKTFVCAAPASNTSHPRLFRSYRSRANANRDCTLLEAARASTATPGLFSPISIGPEHIGEIFVSAELGWNNPTDELTEEASRVFKGQHITCIINIGSGHPGHLCLSNGLNNLFSRITLDCERAVERMEHRFGELPGMYRRLSVGQGMQNLDINLTNLHEVVSHAQSYLQGSHITRNIDDLVHDLALRPKRILVDTISGIVPNNSRVLHPKILLTPTLYFTGRKIELQTLEEYFKSPSDSSRVGVLYGIGGGGKTQIGLQFIQMCGHLFSEIFFIDASDRLTLENSLKCIASGCSDNPSVDDAMFLLRSRREDWLLFLDNADDTTLDLRPYVSWPHGNILITTRNREVRSHAPNCSIWVDRLELDDAKELLLRGVDVDRNSKTQEYVLKIVQELGYLALAINQARAFLAKGLCTLAEYLPIYTQNRKNLLDDKSIQSTDGYKHTVYTTWTISFNKLSSDATLLLELLSHMHHESIPCCLFERAWYALKEEDKDAVPLTVITFLSGLTAVDSTWDALRFRTLIGEILSFSLLEFNVISYSISLHPLVQHWVQNHCQHHQDAIIPTVQTLLCLATPREWSSQDYAMKLSLLPHLRESTKSGVHLHYSLLPYIARVYRHGGMLQEHFDICRRALFESQQSLGSADLNTLNRMGDLVISYLGLGRHRDALKLSEEEFQLRKQILGSEHPDTLETMSDLALIKSYLGQYQDALKLNEEAFEAKKRILGYEHPKTLTIMSNFALAYSDLGQYQHALKLNEELLEVKMRVLGREHPDTLVTMNNLAKVYQQLGQYQDALELNEKVLEVKRRVLGHEHPATLKTMSNLAAVYSDLGRYPGALKLNEKVLELQKRILIHEHPETLKTTNSLAWNYSVAGRYEDALELNKEVLQVRKRVLGYEHPDTLITLSNVAAIYLNLGYHQEALKMNKKVLEVRKRILGHEHPDTMTAMSNLVLTYSKLGLHQDALIVKKELLEVKKHVLECGHSDTCANMSNIGWTYSQILSRSLIILLPIVASIFFARISAFIGPE